MITNEQNCPNCSTELRLEHKLRFNVYRCPGCALRISDASFDHSFQSNIEESSREVGLQKLRFENFELIVNQLGKLRDIKILTGLEVGVGNGWWLKTCQDQKINCIGIEPENTFRSYYQQHGLKVYEGFYPENRPDDKLYDFIIFNDVFEHIPHVNQLIKVLHSNLAPNGLLIINIPMSTGLFYQLARFLDKIGMSGFLERMWQFNFHSPHFTYFNTQNLTEFLTKNQFKKLTELSLKTLDFSTLSERISTDKGFGKAKAAMLAPMLQLLRPVVATASPDTKAFFFQKQ